VEPGHSQSIAGLRCEESVDERKALFGTSRGRGRHLGAASANYLDTVTLLTLYRWVALRVR